MRRHSKKSGYPFESFAVGRILGSIALSGSLALSPAPLIAADDAPLNVVVNIQPQGGKGETAAWLGYILARAHFVDEHHGSYRQVVGPIAPSYIEELTARKDAVKIYREMLVKDRTLDVPYFDELIQVEDAAFMPEYVWTFLRGSTWTTAPPNLKLVTFEAWCKVHLPGHHAVSKGSLQFVAHQPS
jgi:hypothetical protein